MVEGNDLTEIDGKGPPGTTFSVWWRQRLFATQAPAPVPYFPYQCVYSGLSEIWWRDFTTADWVHVGPASVTVPASGLWRIRDIDIQVLPWLPSPPSCPWDDRYSNTYNWFELRGSGFSPSTPTVSAWYRGPGWLDADIGGAHALAAAIADGPDDGDEGTGLVLDVGEVGANVCHVFGCGAEVKVRCEGGDLPCPRIDLQGGGSEFPFVIAMAAAHRPGGSILVASLLESESPGAAPVRVNINAEDQGCICGACDPRRYFDFF